MDKYMQFFKEVWHNQPSTLLGVGLATLILLGIYLKLLDIYK